MFFKVLNDLLLGFGEKAQAPSVAGNAGSGTDREGTGIPQRVHQAFSAVQFHKALLAPGQMITFLFRGIVHALAGDWILSSKGLALIEGLGANFPDMIHPHVCRGLLDFPGTECFIFSALPRIGPFSNRRHEQGVQAVRDAGEQVVCSSKGSC